MSGTGSSPVPPGCIGPAQPRQVYHHNQTNLGSTLLPGKVPSTVLSKCSNCAVPNDVRGRMRVTSRLQHRRLLCVLRWAATRPRRATPSNLSHNLNRVNSWKEYRDYPIAKRTLTNVRRYTGAGVFWGPMTAVRGTTFGNAAVQNMERARGARAAATNGTIFIFFLNASPRASSRLAVGRPREGSTLTGGLGLATAIAVR